MRGSYNGGHAHGRVSGPELMSKIGTEKDDEKSPTKRSPFKPQGKFKILQTAYTTCNVVASRGKFVTVAVHCSAKMLSSHNVCLCSAS